MMNYNNILKVASTLSLAVLFSCAEIEDPQSEAVGYLAAPALEVDITVQDIAQTKTSAPIVDGPSESDIRFVVKDKDGNVKYDGVGLWTEAIVLPVGAYTVDASYGSNGFGAAYFTGTAAGTIEPLDNEIPALKVSLANSLICIELDSDFAQHFFVGSSKGKLGKRNKKYEKHKNALVFLFALAILVIPIFRTLSLGIRSIHVVFSLITAEQISVFVVYFFFTV